MKIWQKDSTTENVDTLKTEKFTVGYDRIWDLRLAKFDVEASQAHAQMLQSCNYLSSVEFEKLSGGLDFIRKTIEEGKFIIEDDIEDVHSQIEKILIEKVGDTGKKIHTGRSRNDQVLVAIRLYLRYEILQIKELVLTFFELLQTLSEKYKDVYLPGYTHYQLAMPSSFGLWFGAYAESLVDDMHALHYAFKIVNKNPLGSAAGFGSAFPLNRTETTRILHFETLNYNSQYAQMTRGKAEKALLSAFSSVAATLSKISYDICLYMNSQLGYLSFPDTLTTGSSIMPHKKNPDVFELIRAKCNRILATPNEITLLQNNLASGYHRDMQLTKDITFPAVDSLKECLEMITYSLNKVEVKQDILNKPGFEYLFTVESINKLVNQGMAFRDAYVKVGNEVNTNSYQPDKDILHTHEGSIGNLCNTEIKQLMEEVAEKIRVPA